MNAVGDHLKVSWEDIVVAGINEFARWVHADTVRPFVHRRRGSLSPGIIVVPVVIKKN